MFRTPKSVTTVTIRGPEWTGHVERMSDDGTVKKVFLGKSDGRKKQGDQN
jgi:hypothetical protein